MRNWERPLRTAFSMFGRGEGSYPTREEFLVAAPAVVESKVRYGLEWFEEQWNRRHQELFPLAA